MSERCEEIIHDIDMALEGLHVVHVSKDLRARLEDDVWHEISDAIGSGFYTQEEGQDMFMQWRITYLGAE